MIQGTVTPKAQAVIDLTVEGPTGKRCSLPVTIDTGFTGFLSLPATTVAELGLEPLLKETVMLADGQYVDLQAYTAAIQWDGKTIAAEIYAVDSDALLGMSLLRGYQLVMDVIENGAVTLTPLNA